MTDRHPGDHVCFTCLLSLCRQHSIRPQHAFGGWQLSWQCLDLEDSLSSDDGYREVLFEGVEEKSEHFTDLGGIALDFSCLWQCDAA